MPREIPNWTWNTEGHNKEEDFGKKCQHIQSCPYRMPDGTICGKVGCIGWWEDPIKSHDEVIYKIIRIQHAHYLVGSYAQGRNTSHIIKGTRVLAEPDETEWVLRLKRNIKIPKDKIEDFRDA